VEAVRGFDLITCFDCLHDMGDPPAGSLVHAREALTPAGS
jgi:hypothetical protein